MENEFQISEVDVLSNSLINEEIKSPIYMDALKFELGSVHIIDIEDVVKNFFNSQPFWLLVIMINIVSKSKLEKSMEGADFTRGFRIGNWKVSNSNKTEIVFGESLGFIEHRLSFCKINNNENEFMAMSSVKTYNRFGAFYFFFVKMVHMKLVKFAINNMYREKYKGAI